MQLGVVQLRFDTSYPYGQGGSEGHSIPHSPNTNIPPVVRE